MAVILEMLSSEQPRIKLLNEGPKMQGLHCVLFSKQNPNKQKKQAVDVLFPLKRENTNNGVQGCDAKLSQVINCTDAKQMKFHLWLANESFLMGEMEPFLPHSWAEASGLVEVQVFFFSDASISVNTMLKNSWGTY